MLSEERVRSLIINSLTKATVGDPGYRDFQFEEDTVLIGTGCVLDSILFTAFATELEERIEDENGREFVLNLEEIFSLNKGKNRLDVQTLAKSVTALLNPQGPKAAKRG